MTLGTFIHRSGLLAPSPCHTRKSPEATHRAEGPYTVAFDRKLEQLIRIDALDRHARSTLLEPQSPSRQTGSRMLNRLLSDPAPPVLLYIGLHESVPSLRRGPPKRKRVDRSRNQPIRYKTQQYDSRYESWGAIKGPKLD